MNINQNDVDTYIGWSLKCHRSLGEVKRAFALSTTFNKAEQEYILKELQNWLDKGICIKP